MLSILCHPPDKNKKWLMYFRKCFLGNYFLILLIIQLMVCVLQEPVTPILYLNRRNCLMLITVIYLSIKHLRYPQRNLVFLSTVDGFSRNRGIVSPLIYKEIFVVVTFWSYSLCVVYYCTTNILVVGMPFTTTLTAYTPLGQSEVFIF